MCLWTPAAALRASGPHVMSSLVPAETWPTMLTEIFNRGSCSHVSLEGSCQVAETNSMVLARVMGVSGTFWPHGQRTRPGAAVSAPTLSAPRSDIPLLFRH